MRNRVWVYEFDQTRTPVGRGVRQLTVTEEYKWECMGIRPANRKKTEKPRSLRRSPQLTFALRPPSVAD